MDIVKLPVGEEAPKDSDCISLKVQADGTCYMNGSLLLIRGDSDEAESISIIGSDPYASVEEAESAGLAWVAEHGIGKVFVSTTTSDSPSETTS